HAFSPATRRRCAQGICLAPLAPAALAAWAMSRLTGLAVAFPKGGLSGVRHLDPLRVGRDVGDVTLVPIPPLVRSALGVALRRILPTLLTPERGHVEIAPGGPHRLVAAAVDEVGAEHALAVADERVVAVPFIHPEIDVEAVGDSVPGDFPTHPRLQARDVGLRCTRGIHQRRVARVQVGEVGDLVGPQRTPDAGMLRPAMYAGLKEGAVDDQLTPALEQAEQAHLALR